MGAEHEQAGRRTASWFSTTHPDWTLGVVELLVSEPDRDVFVLRYKRPTLERPAPYLIVGVNRTTQEVQEIDLQKWPKYRLLVQGRK